MKSLLRPLFFSRLVYPGAIFRIITSRKELYLTFDDGPSPESTPGILGVLDECDIKATFFCSGKEAEKYPELMSNIISMGHNVGNHGYRHLNGWRTKTRDYESDVTKAEELTSKDLFRPPYGKIRLSQYRLLVRKYTIVFWDVLCFDFDYRIQGNEVLKELKKKIRPGSVIVMHDKPTSSVLVFLEEFISWALEEGYCFVKLISSAKK